MLEVNALPHGFLGPVRLRRLYGMALEANAILEIGPWVGRSTSAICHAIKDSGRAVHFETCDFFCDSDEEWERRFGFALSTKKNAERYRKVMRSPGGSRGELLRNLSVRGLLQYVSVVHKGDFLEIDFGRRFDMIFCDATHTEVEIDRTGPGIAKLIEPGGMIACDDIKTSALECRLLEHVRLAWYRIEDGMLYGRAA